jgi:glutathione-regulated potassium-efflux system ancillary protein KefG
VVISGLSMADAGAWSGMSSSRRVLILFAYPALWKSRINRRLLAAAQSVAGVTVRDLYVKYPDFMIDVKREQALLETHDVILYQHPLYWYSCPAILKEWLNLVLEHGFAYGTGGRALEGKWQGSVLSTGGPAEAYRAGGYNHFTIRQLLAPFEQTANLCRMGWLPPFLVQDSFTLDEAGLERHAADYAGVLELLRDGAGTTAFWQELESMNAAVRQRIEILNWAVRSGCRGSVAKGGRWLGHAIPGKGGGW